MSDRVFGIVGLVLAAFYIWAASIIPDSFMVDVIGPRAFPYMVGTVLAICSLVFLLRPDSEPMWPHFRDFIEIVFAAAVMFLYAWVLPEIGFVISTVFATAYLTMAARHETALRSCHRCCDVRRYLCRFPSHPWSVPGKGPFGLLVAWSHHFVHPLGQTIRSNATGWWLEPCTIRCGRTTRG